MAKKFGFTFITTFYNTEDYLKECIESVINQDIDFDDNIQLILVNDGSTDKSIDIAVDYQKLYSDNVFVFTKENESPAIA